MLPMPLVGSLLLLKYAADGHEWAQCFYQELLPMPRNEPIISAENVVDSHEWAQCFNE